MMAIGLGIIAEYNPFHNGHLLHLQNSKAKVYADYVVVVMSGNFSQRGNISIVSKWDKTQMAIRNGADIVIELPTLYSISSAENFAEGAVRILKDSGIVDYLSFGVENDNIDDIKTLGKFLNDEPLKYKKYLKYEMEKGLSFPKARENAVTKYFNNKKYNALLEQPNNILALEYIKALNKNKCNIEPYSLKREKVLYNEQKVIDDFASSTGIRYLLMNNRFDEIAKVIPKSSYNILKKCINNGTYVKDITSFDKIIIYKLREMTIEQIANLPEVSEGLEFSIQSAARNTNNLVELINKIKSKRYTQTRIQRILLYSILNITKKDMEMSKKIIPYIRVLGCSNSGKRLLPKLSWDSTVITSVKRFEEINTNRRYKRMLEIDKYASDIYTLGYESNSKCNLDYTNGLILR